VCVMSVRVCECEGVCVCARCKLQIYHLCVCDVCVREECVCGECVYVCE